MNIKIITIAALMVLTIPIISATATDDFDGSTNAKDFADRCENDGYYDGQNGPFNHDRYDECGEFYYDEFIVGCMEASNDGDVCTQATDE